MEAGEAIKAGEAVEPSRPTLSISALEHPNPETPSSHCYSQADLLSPDMISHFCWKAPVAADLRRTLSASDTLGIQAPSSNHATIKPYESDHHHGGPAEHDSSSALQRGGSEGLYFSGTNRRAESNPQTLSPSEAMKFPFIRATLGQGNALDSKLKAHKEGFQRVNFESLFFTSRPVDAALVKPVFQVFVIVLAVFFGLLVMRDSIVVVAQRSQSVKYLRFVVLEVRDGRETVNTVSVDEFGVLTKGCPIVGEGRQVTVENTSTIEYDSVQAASGFFFVTGNDSSAHPVRYEFLSSLDSKSWNKVAASTTQFFWGGTIVHYTERVDTPSAPNSLVKIDTTAPVSWILTSPMTFAIMSISCAGLAVLGRIGLERYGNGLFAGMVFFISCLFFVSIFTTDYWRSRITSASAVVQATFLWIRLLWFQKHLIYTLLYLGMLSLCGALIELLVVTIRGHGYDIRNFMFGTLLMVPSLIVLQLRRRTILQTRNLVEPDRLNYDRIWDSIIQDTQQYNDLCDLKEEIDRIIVKLPQESRQRNRPAALTVSVQEHFQVLKDQNQLLDRVRMVFNCGNSGNSVCSMDQLYCQAEGLHPILIHKVQQWASMTNGRFAVRTQSTTDDSSVHQKCDCEFKKWNEIDQSELSKELVMWAKIKTEERAVEKCLRSYGGDPSRLCDITRQSITVHDVRDLSDCVREIEKDEQVMLLRIKNRLDPDYDSKTSAGYRDLQLHLRSVTPETFSLGCELHVCELQLILTKMAEVKNEKGHKNYIEFRNKRGE